MRGEARRAASLGDAAAPSHPFSAGSANLAGRRGLLRPLQQDRAIGRINASCSLSGLKAQLLFDGFMTESVAPWPRDVAGGSLLEAVLVHQDKGT